jgi:hypothetical protein
LGVGHTHAHTHARTHARTHTEYTVYTSRRSTLRQRGYRLWDMENTMACGGERLGVLHNPKPKSPLHGCVCVCVCLCVDGKVQMLMVRQCARSHSRQGGSFFRAAERGTEHSDRARGTHSTNPYTHTPCADLAYISIGSTGTQRPSIHGVKRSWYGTLVGRLRAHAHTACTPLVGTIRSVPTTVNHTPTHPTHTLHPTHPTHTLWGEKKRAVPENPHSRRKTHTLQNCVGVRGACGVDETLQTHLPG